MQRTVHFDQCTVKNGISGKGRTLHRKLLLLFMCITNLLLVIKKTKKKKCKVLRKNINRDNKVVRIYTIRIRAQWWRIYHKKKGSLKIKHRWLFCVWLLNVDPYDSSRQYSTIFDDLVRLIRQRANPHFRARGTRPRALR